MEIISTGFLGVSLLFNGYLFYLLRRARKAPVPKLDVTAQDLMHDLTRRGQAVLRVEVIDPTNLMLRSPRG